MEGSEYFCCEGCFEHFWLRSIAKESGARQGCCFYCGTVLTPRSAGVSFDFVGLLLAHPEAHDFQYGFLRAQQEVR